jgi:dihydropteroate synthase
VVVGLSRKRFLGLLTDRGVEQRLAGSLAGLCWCLNHGVQVMRVHDVEESRDAARVVAALRDASAGAN